MESRRVREKTGSLGRPFLVLIVATFLASVGFLAWFLADHAASHRRASRQSRTLEETILLAAELRRGMDRQHALLEQAKETTVPRLQAEFLLLDFELASRAIAYLTLDLRLDERLAVETIRELQAELALAATRVFEHTKVGNVEIAEGSRSEVEALRKQIAEQFEGLHVLQAASLRALEESMDSRPRTTMLAVFVAAIALVLVAFFLLLRRRVMMPVRRLLEAQTSVRRGDFAARVPVSVEDELGQVIRGFNYMAESLGHSYADLERKVAERTRELRELQDQLVQSEKMSAVGRLVSGVAHELNNPLTSILGFVELVRDDLAKDAAQVDAVRRLDVVLEQCKRCGAIVVNLLQFVRKGETVLEPTPLDEVVLSALRLRAYRLETEPIELETWIEKPSPVVRADRRKLQQVVLVLLNNAVDAIREAGREGTVRVELRREGEHAVLRMIDDGTGIREPDRLFEPFYTTKEPGHGTGLGLSVSYGIVGEHSGEITARNRERGAEFTVRLPLAGDAVASGAETRAAPEHAAARADVAYDGTALVVDDEACLVELQEQLLRSVGLRVESATTGEQALEWLQSRQFDVIVSDVRMPGSIDGVRLYRWVCEHRPALKGRFLLTTGDTLGMDRASDEDLPFTLDKPFSADDYLRVVRRLLDRNRVSP